jgi:hypothetical protein
MNIWLDRVAELTAAHREGRANAYAGLRKRRAWKRRFEGFSEAYAKADGAWYAARERGQRERPKRVAACGSEVLQVSCLGCGTVHELRSGCRITLLCVPCRSVSAAAKRRTFRRARAVVIGAALMRGLFREKRRGGRWSEKFLTLTAPHFAHQTVTERIDVVLAAWVRFLRLLNAFWKSRDVKSAEWFRVFEWTPGKSDNLGHPHLHIWILSPFLPRDEIERWWREAVAEQTALAGVERLIVDIREVHADGAEHELIKYLTKDITANGEKVAPEVYAEVYIALDGHRSTQASKGFMGKAKLEKRVCECGCALPRQVRKEPKKKDGKTEDKP